MSECLYPEDLMKKANLTPRYALHQIIYFAAECGTMAFASTYLLNSGLSADKVGLVLFGASFLSFLGQPLAADIADKAERNILPALIMGFSLASILCFAVVRFVPLGILSFSVLYMMGMFLFDVQVPLINSVSVYYSSRDWTLNYGVGRGLGSVGFAVASLFVGRLLEVRMDWMLPFGMILTFLNGLMAFTYPKDETKLISEAGDGNTVGLFEFFGKYGWYTVSLLGVALIGLIHIMTEYYMIEIMRLHGGDSSNVGLIFSLSTFAEIPAIVLFSKFHDRLGTKKIFILSSAVFVVKMMLYLFAPSIKIIMLASLLMLFSYGLYCPVLVYYANECIRKEDMVKGQSTVYASYSLGGAIGCLVGGTIISASGVGTMLIAAVIMGVAGLAVLLFTVPRALKTTEQSGETT